MVAVQTPGVYFQSATRQRPAGLLARSDIVAFLGYARQGPADLPIRLHAWRQFLSVFGAPYEVGYLADAVKGFFENGGVECYVVRLTDGTAAVAALTLPTALNYRWTFSASYPLSVLAAWMNEGGPPDTALRLAGEQTAQPSAKRSANPGQWGNQLSVSLDRDAVSNTWTFPGLIEDGYVTEVQSITGLAAGAIVQLHQEPMGGEPPSVPVERVDSARNLVYWSRSLRGMGLDLSRPIRLESVEFSLQVALDNRVVETFAHLAIHPEHPRFIGTVLRNDSLYLELKLDPPAGAGESDYVDPGYWPPAIFNRPLGGGSDGLTAITADHYLLALAHLEKVPDIGLLAAPDLVLRAGAPLPSQPPGAVAPADCRRLDEVPRGVLFGRVVSLPEGSEAGAGGSTPLAVAAVTVTYAAGAKQQRTAADGTFRLENIDTGLITLRFEKGGYEVEEQMTLVQAVASAEPVEFYLKPLSLPPAFGDDDVLRVQQAMMAQGEAGLYRFALLDPPQAEMKLDEIRGWRQKLGDSAHGGLYFPWLGVPRPSTGSGSTPLKWVPPSGHLAGIIARTDWSEGVHRAPANFALRNVKRLAVEVDDIQHGILNSEGINCIRCLAGRGLLSYGARTLSSSAEWRYLNVRRLVSVLEKTLESQMQWAVFESNSTLLRQAVSYNIGALLNRLWRQGALAGTRPEAAYAVKCDEDNNPPGIRDAGQLIAEIAVAPSVPYEFIILRLGKTLDAIEVTE